MYNPVTNAWTEVANSPTGHSYSAMVASLNGRTIYAIGSYGLDAYNIATNTWTTVTSLPNSTRVDFAAATGPDGRIYVIGGNYGGAYDHTSDVDAYDVNTNTWTKVAGLPDARFDPAATTGPDGRIYAIGGYTAYGEVASSEVDAYNLSTNTWTKVASLPYARGALGAATGPNGLIYAIAGRNGYATFVNEVDAYNTNTNTWIVVDSLPSTRESLGAVLGQDGRIYAIGGNISFSNGQVNEVDAYIPSTPYLHKVTPIVSWSNPADITYGTALGLDQLDATASVPGTFTYTITATGQSADGAVLHAGTGQSLSAIFTPTDTADYNIVTATAMINVISTPLTVTATNATKVYGSSNPVLTGTITGLVNGDKDVATYSTTATAGSPVGNYAITPSLTDPNYAITFNNSTLSVISTPLTVTATNATKVYGSSNPVLTGTITGLVNGDKDVATYSTTATAGSPVGNYAITPSLTDPNYAITFNNSTLSVTPAPLTVTANDASKVYGQANPALTGTITGLVNGDKDVATYSTTATAGSPVGNYAITPSLTDPNYAITFNNSTLSVTPAPLTVTANDASKVYGQANPALTGTITGLVNGDKDTATFGTDAMVGSPVGNYVITPSLSDSNYAITYVPGTLAVTPAPLTITADNQTKVYGAALPTLTASYSGFQNGDTAASLTSQPTLSTDATAASAVVGSPYAITASGAADGNYSITYVLGSLTVTPAPLTITADNQTKVYGQANPALTGTITGLVNGDKDTATFGTDATVGSSVGGYAITPSLSDTNYAIIHVPGTLAVTPAPLTITANDATKVQGQVNPALTGTISGLVNGDQVPVTYSTTATINSTPGAYPITPAVSANSNYWVTLQSGTLTVTAAPVLAPAQRNTIFVTALYRYILGHDPNLASLNSWVNRLLAGTSAGQMATTLWNSAEHRTLLRRHHAPALSYNSALGAALQSGQPVSVRPQSVAFVTTLYREILGHNPNPASLNFWVKRLLAGTSQNQVALAIWNSPEHRTLVKRHRAPQITGS